MSIGLSHRAFHKHAIPTIIFRRTTTEDNTVVDSGWYGVIWNDQLDLSRDELWKRGTQIKTRLMVSLRLVMLRCFWDWAKAHYVKQSPMESS